ncbi:hypothetical protein SEA_DELIAN_52 [Gordonia phage Delian]|uniref:hypothetical protein n=1 Tax=Gordonia phage CaptainKirk2 TaxID=1887643 RepID=UPI00084F131A|nr:hypothetical protein BIZ76_gp49 [Gordonia phage CaptainKirk2]AXH67474.1 hypothetical protein SEA_ZARBODNAMRA_48 [Gordonia phage Zarbodnamra]QBG78522.1 hypothetical protein SEA_BARCO_47 [Gordonia phage Barco]QDH85370.1 hypothetical protein SEA_MINTFEN_49 [Gordonia phage MintFen]QGH77972.1 hypothetical protein SEA_DELIAN_52 [Gordonia phage Delian]QKO02367.1 hypothetical protein SEA_BLINGBLING_46 [Gordonia phage BlingBling]QNJ58457.1 hypothetical protein SEA_ARCHIS_52 [Gordonia phage Archis]
MIATRVILRGPKATLDELAAFVAEARHRGVAGDAAIQFRGATGLGAFAAFSVDVPARLPAARGDEDVHSVAVACDSGCGREVTLTFAAPSPDAAAEAAIKRLTADDGWSVLDGNHCRACSLIRAGWSAAPGPKQDGHEMSAESAGGES